MTANGSECVCPPVPVGTSNRIEREPRAEKRETLLSETKCPGDLRRKIVKAPLIRALCRERTQIVPPLNTTCSIPVEVGIRAATDFRVCFHRDASLQPRQTSRENPNLDGRTSRPTPEQATLRDIQGGRSAVFTPFQLSFRPTTRVSQSSQPSHVDGLNASLPSPPRKTAHLPRVRRVIPTGDREGDAWSSILSVPQGSASLARAIPSIPAIWLEHLGASFFDAVRLFYAASFTSAQVFFA
jgi:hypothetical protein